MDIKALTATLESLVCLALIVTILSRLWSEARLDRFRQRMFSLRDQVFDFAADGNIDFDDPAYRLLRRSMNGYIRYAHQLTFFRVCVTIIEISLSVHKPNSDWTEQWEKALGSVQNERVREKLAAFHNQSSNLVAERLIMGSPFLIGLAIFAALFLAIRMGLRNLGAIVNRIPQFTLSHVIDTRIIENEAAGVA